MKVFQVSVIIPVYKAEQFVERAVQSAVVLPEVGEVILIEDNSPDNSLAVCQQLVQRYSKVKLLQHADSQNKGAAASRNLGIENAIFEFIAFLDADDWYLPFRFERDREIFTQIPAADAAYSCSSLEDDLASPEKRYGAHSDIRQVIGQYATSLEFYEYKCAHKSVMFDTNGITLRKTFLIQDKLFDDRLRLHQDAELWRRLIRRGNFYAAEITRAVAVVRRHPGNRITNKSVESQLKMLGVFLDNVGLANLYPFEERALFVDIIRMKSKKFQRIGFRRVYYYLCFFAFGMFRKYYLTRHWLKYAPV